CLGPLEETTRRPVRGCGKAPCPAVVDPPDAKRQGPPRCDAAGAPDRRRGMGSRHLPGSRGPRLQRARPGGHRDAPHGSDPPGGTSGRHVDGADGGPRRGPPRIGDPAPAQCLARASDPEVRPELAPEGARGGPHRGHRADMAPARAVQRGADRAPTVDGGRRMGRGDRVHVAPLLGSSGEGEAVAERLPLRRDLRETIVDDRGTADGGAPRDPRARSETRSTAGGEPLKERALVEAALYSAGRALTIDELARTTRLDPEAIKGHLRALAGQYTKRERALEVAQIGTKWTVQVRAEYTERARAFAPPEIDRDLLKTVALIAYHQPILQSNLFDMIGSKVYEPTKGLEALGLISRNPARRSFALATTRYFAEFFGLKSTDRG